MALQTITLALPDYVVERARQVAETTAQPFEDVLVKQLEAAAVPLLPPDEEAELASLRNFSDDALWTIAQEQMATKLQARMKILMEKNSRGTISASEYQELETLVDRGQRLMLRKSEAAALLTERGYKVTRQNLRARD